MFDQILQDTRIAIRGFRRSPRFALSAILTIAIAVGAATAVFSVADRSLFRALPYRADDRLVSIGVVAPVIHSRDWMFAGAYRSWRHLSSDTFESMTSWKGVVDCDQTGNAPRRLSCAQVEANFLSTLGVAPILGRDFEPDEDRPGAEPVVLVSNGLWQRQFGGEREVWGQRIAIDGVAARIIGVLPPTFETPSLAPADALLPLKLAPEGERQRLVHVIGRLRNSASVHEAGQRLEVLFRQFLETAPADFRKAVPMRLRVVSLRDQQTADQRLALWMLLAAVLSFLLIACANVAHLLLARSSTRRHEFVVRASLGASGWRLARQALTESTVLAMAGGAVGCALGYWLLQLFQVLAPDGAIRLGQAAIDLRVAAFSLGLSLLAAFLFGLAPAIERLRTEAFSSVRVAGGRRRVLRGALVSVQLAISVVLLSATGTLLWSLWRLQQVQLGIRPASVVTASLVLPQQQYPNSERQAQFFVDLYERLQDVPGFTSSAIADSLPPGGDPRSKPFVALLGGGDSAEKGMEGLVKWRYVTPGYFETMGIAMVRGRGFSREDFLAGRKAIVLSESLARRLYGEADPIGRHLRQEEAFEIVGVAADVRNAGVIQAPDPEYYVLRLPVPDGVWRNQRPPLGWRNAVILARSSLDDGAAMSALEDVIHAQDPSLAITVSTLPREVGRYFSRPRFETALFSFLALAGLLLAAVGVYGLASYMAAERAREVGVRIALGATPSSIVRLMIRGNILWTAAGALLGMAAAVPLLRPLQAMLFEVQPLHPLAILAAAAVLCVVALIGLWLPSARASRIDPALALRQD